MQAQLGDIANCTYRVAQAVRQFRPCNTSLQLCLSAAGPYAEDSSTGLVNVNISILDCLVRRIVVTGAWAWGYTVALTQSSEMKPNSTSEDAMRA
jgi:hypothetical protein